MSLPQEVETLKAEGNAFYLAGDHTSAIQKYTVAINIMSDNAILFANRAACHLALERYKKARDDARKATELDPKYAKAWGRLGAALEGLSEHKEALDMYGKAIECIDAVSPLSDADKRLKAQYKSSHAKMERLTKSRHVIVKESDIKYMKMPWELAREMWDKLPVESSGFTILTAHNDFELSKSIFKTLTRLPNGTMSGQLGGLEDFSNAILTDERCIMLKGGDSLIKDCNQYLQFEICRTNAWEDVEKPREIIRLAKHSLRRTGDWNSVRDALACQVRAWIIMGYMGQISDAPRDELFAYFNRACKLIELGRTEWPDVPQNLRGSIFEKTFLRGVQVQRVNAYMRAYNVKHLRTSGKFTLDGLMALADEIISQVDITPPEVVEDMRTNPYFYLAYYIYPKAVAWSIRGYVYYRRASFESKVTILEDCEWAKKSGEAYVKSADLYPEDDENHCCTYASY